MINEKINILKSDDKKFPKQLYKLNDCPKKLYAIGNLDLLNKFRYSYCWRKIL